MEFSSASARVDPVRVLVVEDSLKLAALLRRGLHAEGVLADVAVKGEDALWIAGSTGYDAIVLDVMLPGIDGFETCRRLGAEAVWTPVLMLTARDAVRDRVAGLDGGADDYLTKPFSFAELLARLRALLARRGPVERPAVLEVGALRLDPAARRVWRGTAEIGLSTEELLARRSPAPQPAPPPRHRRPSRPPRSPAARTPTPSRAETRRLRKTPRPPGRPRRPRRPRWPARRHPATRPTPPARARPVSRTRPRRPARATRPGGHAHEPGNANANVEQQGQN